MKNLLFKCVAVVLLLAAQGFEVTVWAQTVSNYVPPREQWVEIFEKNNSYVDRAQAKQERKTWPSEMLDGFHDWLIAKGNESRRRADEEKRQTEVLKARIDEDKRQTEVLKARADELQRQIDLSNKLIESAKLLGSTVEHWKKFDNQRNSERLQLENRMQNNEMLMNSEIMSKHVMDYIKGKPITREYLQSVQKWLIENHPDRQKNHGQ